jgi:cytosine/adenosine deaminase-related metal-dependent hydrolase
MYVEGTVLRGPDLEPVEGRVVVDDGEIAAVEECSTASDDVVLPAFVNAHTHLGDSIAKDAGLEDDLSLAELVAPPDGLKHRLLDAADREEMVTAMRRSLRFMAATGTGTCLEFREGGVDGVGVIREAAEATDLGVDPVVLGRGSIEAMHAADGFGASGANDANFEQERRATREAGKLFGIHAGEVDETDLNPALDLDPDFLVHVVHPDPVHLERIADSQVPVVLCPRSNAVTDVGLPPAADLVERTTVALGTDNVFTNSPSMFREMAFLGKVADLDARTVLQMATVNGAEIAGLNRGVVEAGREARLLVLDGDSDNLSGTQNPVRAVVHRAGASDVKRLVT